MKSFYGIRSAIQGKIKLSFYNLKKKIVCGGVGGEIIFGQRITICKKLGWGRGCWGRVILFLTKRPNLKN